MLAIILGIIEKTGDYNWVLVVSDVLDHESQIIMKSIVFMKTDYNELWFLFDVDVCQNVVFDDSLSVLECLFWKLYLNIHLKVYKSEFDEGETFKGIDQHNLLLLAFDDS